MSREPWIANATAPTDAEVARVASPVPAEVFTRLADATAPSAHEVQRLARVRVLPGRAPVLPAVIGLAALAAATALWVSVPDAPVAKPAEAPREERFEVMRVDAVEVSGLGDVAVERTPDGVVVDVRHGAAAVATEPASPPVVVRVGVVVFRGAKPFVLDVMRAGDAVEVQLHQGTILATAPGREDTALTAPATFVWAPEPVAAVVEVPIAPSIDRTPAEPQEMPVASEDRPSRDQARAFRAILDAVEGQEDRNDILVDIHAFLAAWPESPYATEARVIELRMTAGSATPSDWLLDAATWRMEYPRSARQAEIAVLEGDVRRARVDDCAKALPLYESVVTGPFADRAEAGRGLCLAKLGRPNEAAPALAHALQGELDVGLRSEVVRALDDLGVE